MQMTRSTWLLRTAVTVLLAVPFLTSPTATRADGRMTPTLSFFSSGHGAHADWLATDDQPPGDTDNQAIRLLTTNEGYAGILVHHVTGIPALAFPDSSFWVKTPDFAGPSLGSPRLIVAFQNAAGVSDGYADLRPLALAPTWQQVSTPNWDVMNVLPSNPCFPFRYEQTWSQVQTCFAADVTQAVYLTTDPYGVYHLIDDLNVGGTTFSSAADNGNGINNPAGPEATTDPSLLPSIFFLPPPR